MVALCGWLASCGKPAVPTAEFVRQVVAIPAVAGSGASVEQYHGEIRARDETTLSFRVGGKLVERPVRLGDSVRRGQLLARLDDSDLARERSVASAALVSAESNLQFAAAQQARTRAEGAQGLAAPADVEQADNAAAAAAAARDSAVARLELAQRQVGYAELRADRDGVITREDSQPGQVIAAGQPLLGFAATAQREVVIDVPEGRRGGLERGSRLQVALPALPGRLYHATVRELAAAADSGSRTYAVKATLEDAGPEVALGMSADASVPGAAPSSPRIRVPSTALFHAGEKPAVWIVDTAAGRLALRPVSLASYVGREIELGSGVQPGEMVVIAGVHTLDASEKVVAVPPLHPDDGQP